MDFFENFIINNVKIQLKDKRLKNFRSEKDIIKFILFDKEFINQSYLVDRDSIQYFFDILNNKQIDNHVLVVDMINKKFKIHFINNSENKIYENYLVDFLLMVKSNNIKNSICPLFIKLDDKKNVLSFMGFEYGKLIVKIKYSILTQCQAFLSKGKK